MGLEHAAILRRDGRKGRLEIHAKHGAKWTLTQAIACDVQDALAPFAGGRGLVVGWEDAGGRLHPKTHFLGFDDGPRLLGTSRLEQRYVFDHEGRSFFQGAGAPFSAMPSELYEIEGFDEASERASKKKPALKLA